MLTPSLEAPNELPVYNWHPAVLAKANASAEYCSLLLRQHLATLDSASREDSASLMDWINKNLVIARLGITDAQEYELSTLAENPESAVIIFSRMVSMRARVGWSTHGHSAVDVNIYSSGGAAAEKIRGNVENTDIGKFLSAYLDVDVDEITKELEDKLESLPVTESEAEVQGGETGGHPEAWVKAHWGSDWVWEF